MILLLSSNARAETRDGVCREPLTSKNPRLPSSSLTRLFAPSARLPHAVSREALSPAYISLIKSKAAGPHTSDPIYGLFCALRPSLSRSLSLTLSSLSLFFLPSFLLRAQTCDSLFALPLTSRPLNRPRSFSLVCPTDYTPSR